MKKKINNKFFTKKNNSKDKSYINGTDWSTVPMDADVLIREEHSGMWIPRHFAKYKNGHIFIFVNGYTSKSTTEVTKQNYVILVDSSQPIPSVVEEKPESEFQKIWINDFSNQQRRQIYDTIYLAILTLRKKHHSLLEICDFLKKAIDNISENIEVEEEIKKELSYENNKH